ncbi:glycosyl hydrolase [Nonomuraea sp. SYSU D8015]|uniref:glycosyl hydrolase n=1 Tax=Nonomuraea sp. SYSU D8015 TaxID=2593644 RepID=UPI0016601947|nr:glycosyl hydrolase [Nonomuraea sp. SYSU D8015]
MAAGVAGAVLAPVATVPGAAAAAAKGLLRNPGFEGTHKKVAPGWRVQSWGAPAPKKAFTPAEKAHGGRLAQRFQVTAHPERVHLVQRLRFAGGRTYRAGIWVRAAAPVDVTLQVRGEQGDSQTFAVRTVRAGTGWQLIEATGTAPRDLCGSFRVSLGAPGTVWIDDASLTDVTAVRRVTPLSHLGTIPADYFGMHMKCRGCSGDTWPSIGFGAWRMWDNGVRWRDLEPVKGTWSFATMDSFLSSAGKYGVAVIYTLGVPPAWAAADGASPPRNPEDWRAYVRTVATRYKGRIRAYEMWNEPDQRKSWNGTPAQLAELTRIAAEEIRRADPAARIISPGITVNGLSWLDRYFAAGAAKHVDIVGGHVYLGLRPESAMSGVANLRAVADQHGLAGRPLRVTEGAPLGKPADTYQARGVVSRTLALFWASGAAGFDWQGWDRHGADVIDLAKAGDRLPTAVGSAYAATVSWLKGARMTLHTVSEDGTHVITLDRDGGYVAHMVWNERGSVPFRVPVGWRASRMHVLSGGSVKAPPGIVAGASPVLLESAAAATAVR